MAYSESFSILTLQTDCNYINITHYYVVYYYISLPIHYCTVLHHYCIIIASLLLHYYIIITNGELCNNDSIIRCYSKRMLPFLHHYYPLLNHHYKGANYCQSLHISAPELVDTIGQNRQVFHQRCVLTLSDFSAQAHKKGPTFYRHLLWTKNMIIVWDPGSSQLACILLLARTTNVRSGKLCPNLKMFIKHDNRSMFCLLVPSRVVSSIQTLHCYCVLTVLSLEFFSVAQCTKQFLEIPQAAPSICFKAKVLIQVMG